MTIDRSELFRIAWTWAKQDLWSLRLTPSRFTTKERIQHEQEH